MEALFDRWFLRALLALARRSNDERQLAYAVPRLAEVEDIWRRDDDDRAHRLLDRLPLTSVEIDFLGAVIAFTGDPRLAVHAEALGGANGRRGLTVATFCEIAELDAGTGRSLLAAFGPHHPAIEAGLVEVVDPFAAPSNRPVLAAHRVLAHLNGHDEPERGVTVIETDPDWLFDATSEDERSMIARALLAPDGVLVVEGPRGSGRRSTVAHVGLRPVASIDCDRLDPDTLQPALLALWREATIRDAIAVIANVDALPTELVRRLASYLDPRRDLVVLTTSRGLDLTMSRTMMRARWSLPSTELRRRLWTSASDGYGRVAEDELADLAARYRIGPAAIQLAVRSGAAIASAALDGAALVTGLRHNIGERMSGLAERVEVTQRWSDVVLSEEVREQVEGLVSRARHSHLVLDQWGFRSKMARGAGIAAMFSGPPGTGKTMVSGVIARELGLELYQVDLSQIVSKWIGETEKQLARVFDAAEEGHALLLFDEADALFGQRSTKGGGGATDRYANMEVNFLLQRIESFGGITILTTNLDASVDRALKRRLAAHVVFGTPDEEERTLLWRRLVDTGRAPLAPNIDFAGLARLYPSMTGANIRNSVSSAAFIAAAEEASIITESHLIRAGRSEYRSMGHVLAERSKGSLIR